MNGITSLSNYESCKLWIDGLRSKSTKMTYTIHLSLFCKFHHVNPAGLVRLRPAEIKRMVINYISELKKKCKNTAVNETHWYNNCVGGGKQDGGGLHFNILTHLVIKPVDKTQMVIKAIMMDLCKAAWE